MCTNFIMALNYMSVYTRNLDSTLNYNFFFMISEIISVFTICQTTIEMYYMAIKPDAQLNGIFYQFLSRMITIHISCDSWQDIAIDGSNNSRLHVVEPPRRRFFMESVKHGNADSLLN